MTVITGLQFKAGWRPVVCDTRKTPKYGLKPLRIEEMPSAYHKSVVVVNFDFSQSIQVAESMTSKCFTHNIAKAIQSRRKCRVGFDLFSTIQFRQLASDKIVCLIILTPIAQCAVRTSTTRIRWTMLKASSSMDTSTLSQNDFAIMQELVVDLC